MLSLNARLQNEVSVALVGMRAAPPRSDVDPRTSDGLIPCLALRADDHSAAPSLCCSNIRRALETLTQWAIPRFSDISIAKIPERIDLSSFDMVKVDS